MHYKKIADHEERFRASLTDSAGTKYTQESISEDGFEFKRIRPIDFDNYYVEEETDKNMIVLHATEGYLKGDLAALVKEGSTVGTHFLVARNGEIYELFDQKYWAWHLGRGAVGGNRIGSSRSIAIELSNAGVLERKGDKLYDYNREYCSLDEREAYHELDEPYREEMYFATYTKEQYDSLEKLIDYLSNKYEIPKRYLDEGSRYELFNSVTEARGFNGICSHVNFQAEGKWDIGPAFNWSRFAKTHNIKKNKKQMIIEEDEEDIKKDSHIELDDVEITPAPPPEEPVIEEDEDPVEEIKEVEEKPKKKAEKPKGILGLILDIISELLGRNSV